MNNSDDEATAESVHALQTLAELLLPAKAYPMGHPLHVPPDGQQVGICLPTLAEINPWMLSAAQEINRVQLARGHVLIGTNGIKNPVMRVDEQVYVIEKHYREFLAQQERNAKASK